jgi:small subunit ribosomal protein S2
LSTYSKKRQSTLRREFKKIKRNLEGIRHMNRIPEAVVMIDPKNEKNCVHECQLLGVKVVGLIDTDSNPDDVDLPIPGNDDSIRSIRLILDHLAEVVKVGRGGLPEANKPDEADEPKAVPSL